MSTLSKMTLKLSVLNVIYTDYPSKSFMLSVIVLNVVMLRVVMLNVVAPFVM